MLGFPAPPGVRAGLVGSQAGAGWEICLRTFLVAYGFEGTRLRRWCTRKIVSPIATSAMNAHIS